MKKLILLFLISTNSLFAQTDTTSTIERACPSVFQVVKNGKPYSLRYASNHSISERNDKIERLIIYIHGAKRNGLDYYEWGHAGVKAANADEKTLLISPQFTSEKDLENHQHDATHLFWANNNWRSGDESVKSKKRPMETTISSFALVDSIIARVCNNFVFPKLRKVIVIGHSAGGQFLQRYSGMTTMPQVFKRFKFRFIVMNSSSYLYLDDRRPVNSDAGLTFVRPDTTNCKDFNTFPKGFLKPNPYLANIGSETFKKQFLNREIVFLMGGNDVDMFDSSLDKSCSGNMQGRFRLERGLFFYKYIQTFSPNGKQIHQFGIVPNTAHSGEKMFDNPLTRSYLFDF